jgi:hypothetical protein
VQTGRRCQGHFIDQLISPVAEHFGSSTLALLGSSHVQSVVIQGNYFAARHSILIDLIHEFSPVRLGGIFLSYFCSN